MGGFRSLTGFAERRRSSSCPLGVLIVLGGARASRSSATCSPSGAGAASRSRPSSCCRDDGRPDRRRHRGRCSRSSGRNPATLGALPELERPLNAVFESVAFRSAGMSTVPTGAADRLAPRLVAIALMFIGGASGSTAGGIKITTFAILLVHRSSRRSAAGRHARRSGGGSPRRRRPARSSVALLSIALVFVVGPCLLEVTGAEPTFLALAVRGRVGVRRRSGTRRASRPTLPGPRAAGPRRSTMFIGRLGPLTLVLALSARSRPVPYRPAVETDPHRLTAEGDDA